MQRPGAPYVEQMSPRSSETGAEVHWLTPLGEASHSGSAPRHTCILFVLVPEQHKQLKQKDSF